MPLSGRAVVLLALGLLAVCARPTAAQAAGAQAPAPKCTKLGSFDFKLKADGGCTYDKAKEDAMTLCLQKRDSMLEAGFTAVKACNTCDGMNDDAFAVTSFSGTPSTTASGKPACTLAATYFCCMQFTIGAALAAPSTATTTTVSATTGSATVATSTTGAAGGRVDAAVTAGTTGAGATTADGGAADGAPTAADGTGAARSTPAGGTAARSNAAGGTAAGGTAAGGGATTASAAAPRSGGGAGLGRMSYGDLVGLVGTTGVANLGANGMLGRIAGGGGGGSPGGRLADAGPAGVLPAAAGLGMGMLPVVG